MKTVMNGFGVDTTALVLAALKANDHIWLADLFIIGDPDDPNALRLTNYQGPLYWSLYGKFDPAIIERGAVQSKIGLDVQTLSIKWTPDSDLLATQSLATANPYQKVYAGVYDNWPVRVWKCFMPVPGDADTYGCCELFGGRIGDIPTCQRGLIEFTVNSFLDVIQQKVPTQVVQITNALSGSYGATPPGDLTSVPVFDVIAGSASSEIIGDCQNPAHHIFNKDELHGGFVIFRSDSSSTLGMKWAGIQSNRSITIAGQPYNAILLYDMLPFPPTPGDDTFLISGGPANQLGDGFPYVPNPETAL